MPHEALYLVHRSPVTAMAPVESRRISMAPAVHFVSQFVLVTRFDLLTRFAACALLLGAVACGGATPAKKTARVPVSDLGGEGESIAPRKPSPDDNDAPENLDESDESVSDKSSASSEADDSNTATDSDEDGGEDSSTDDLELDDDTSTDLEIEDDDSDIEDEAGFED